VPARRTRVLLLSGSCAGLWQWHVACSSSYPILAVICILISVAVSGLIIAKDCLQGQGSSVQCVVRHLAMLLLFRLAGLAEPSCEHMLGLEGSAQHRLLLSPSLL
jgi:hypothetical protein